MSDYYRNYNATQVIFEKNSHIVMIGYPSKYYENCGFPYQVIIKKFTLVQIPSEITIHQELSLKSSKVLKVYDVWSDFNTHFLCMEYCSRGDLHHELERLNGNPYTFEFILRKCCDIAETVSLMHDHRYAHRDIKPFNIYIDNDFNFKLADFGETKKIINDEDYHSVRGTPYYMSPEIFDKFNQHNHQLLNPFRDDIWALAKTFAELAMGRLCPEINSQGNFSVNIIKSLFLNFKYPQQFYEIIADMMPTDFKSFLEAGSVLNRLKSLYYSLFLVIPKEVNVFERDPNNKTIMLKTDDGAVNQWDSLTIKDKGTVHAVRIPLSSRGQSIDASFSDGPEHSNKFTNSIKSISDSQKLGIQNVPNSSPESNKTIEAQDHAPRICKQCKNAYTQTFTLRCGDCFHEGCFKFFLEEEIQKANNIDEIKCPECFINISHDIITNFKLLKTSIKYKGTLLSFKSTPCICPSSDCNRITGIMMLSDKLKPNFKRCSSCGTKFCSFCARIGAHRFSCDQFKEHKKKCSQNN
jgi:serine/threonine protein kinase